MIKTIAIIALTAISAAASAQNFDVTATGNRNEATNTNDLRVTVGKQVGALRGEVAVSRDLTGTQRVTNYGANVGLPLATYGGLVVTPKVGVNYLNVQNGVSGYGVRAGATVTYPVTKNVALVGDYSHLRNEAALRSLDGNELGLGVRVGF